MRKKQFDQLAAWSGAALDRLLLDAPEEYEDQIAETYLFMIGHLFAIDWKAMLNDNDN